MFAARYAQNPNIKETRLVCKRFSMVCLLPSGTFFITILGFLYSYNEIHILGLYETSVYVYVSVSVCAYTGSFRELLTLP